MKRFKSTTGKPVRVFGGEGHITIVPTSWKELHERFHSQAYASGCISEDMIKNESMSDVDPKVVRVMNNIALQKNEIEDAMRELVKKNDLKAFGANGKPKSTNLTEMVGFRVTNPVRDEVWARFQETMNESP